VSKKDRIGRFPFKNGAPQNGSSQEKTENDEERVEATTEEVLAAQLHQARAENIALKKQLAQTEIALVEIQNAQLREKHGLALERQLTLDQTDGKWYWVGGETVDKTGESEKTEGVVMAGLETAPLGAAPVAPKA
jgi:hypothetical protein